MATWTETTKQTTSWSNLPEQSTTYSDNSVRVLESAGVEQRITDSGDIRITEQTFGGIFRMKNVTTFTNKTKN